LHHVVGRFRVEVLDEPGACLPNPRLTSHVVEPQHQIHLIVGHLGHKTLLAGAQQLASRLPSRRPKKRRRFRRLARRTRKCLASEAQDARAGAAHVPLPPAASAPCGPAAGSRTQIVRGLPPLARGVHQPAPATTRHRLARPRPPSPAPAWPYRSPFPLPPSHPQTSATNRGSDLPPYEPHRSQSLPARPADRATP